MVADYSSVEHPSLNAHVLSQFEAKGRLNFRYECFSSTMSAEVAPKLLAASQQFAPEACFVISAHGKGATFPKPDYFLTASTRGESIQFYFRDSPPWGNTLEIYLPVSSNKIEPSDGTKVNSILMCVRQLYGAEFANEHKYSALFTRGPATWQPTVVTPSFAGPYDSFGRDAFEAQALDYLGPVHINGAAADLLGLITSSMDLEVRFMLNWTALEAQLARFQGSSSGERRRAFSQDLNSDLIDQELRRLHGVRTRLLKEGDRSGVTRVEEYVLICILRISILPSSGLRSVLQTRIETFLQLSSDAQMAEVGREYRFELSPPPVAAES